MQSNVTSSIESIAHPGNHVTVPQETLLNLVARKQDNCELIYTATMYTGMFEF